MSNKYYFEILSYLSSDQLDDLYKRNLHTDINLAILHHKKNKSRFIKYNTIGIQ